MESQLSRMMTESISVRTQMIDPDEDAKPPRGAEISYLDARALKFWHGKPTDVDIILQLMKQDLEQAQNSGNKEAYRVKSAEMARLLSELGKPEGAIEYYCLSFFLFWHRNTFELKVDSVYAYDYEAKRIDECGKLCGYSFDQTLSTFQKALRTYNPFGLGTEHNVAAVQQVFKKALSV